MACALLGLWAVDLPAATPDFQWPGASLVDAQELTSLDHAQRQRAAERLSARGAPDASARVGLIALLDDPAPSVRVTAGRILARQGAPEAIESATRWTISATPANRRLGLDVLRECPGPLPPPALRAVERSLTDADASVRLLAIDALSRQKDLTISLLPIAAASEDDNREVRLRAIRLLAAARDRRGVVPLLARLSDVDRQARVESINALAAIGDVRVAPALKRQLNDPADDVRIAAALALGKLKIADAVPAIAALARRRSADEVARQAALALGEIGTADAIDALVDRLREPPLVEEVSAGLHRAGELAIPALLAEAARGTVSSSTVAATLLGHLRAGTMGSDGRVTAVLCELVDRRASASRPAMAALGEIRDPGALPALLAATADPLAENRRAAYQALIAIGDDRALTSLDRGLHDPDAPVRVLALRLGASLAATPSPSASAALAGVAARLGDPDPAVSRQAAAALVWLGRRLPGTVPPLLALLGRAPADLAIGDARELRATPADDPRLLAAALRLPGEGQRAIARAVAAAHATQPLPDGPLVELLLQLLAQDGATAEAAADALAHAQEPRRHQTAILRAFAAAEPDVRPRLCAALAVLGGVAGHELLAGLLADPTARPDLRAAAILALTGPSTSAPPNHPGARDPGSTAALRTRLEQATASAEPAVASNARAALWSWSAPARSSPPPGAPGSWMGSSVGFSVGSWINLRLVAPDGSPLAHEWLSVTAGNGVVVWTKSGLDGVAHLSGLPAAGPYQVRVMMNPDLVLHPGRPALRPRELPPTGAPGP